MLILPVAPPCPDPAPPPSALVLFDGTTASAFRPARDSTDRLWPIVDGALRVDQSIGDLVSHRTFGDHLLHVEWRSPPGGIGQGRGNSGVKIQRRYEVQILNTPADVPLQLDDAGSIYNVRVASKNVSSGPGEWQRYDIFFTAPRWDGEKKTSDARMTVYWNGELVHDDIRLAKGTGGSPRPERPEADSVLLQAHFSNASGDVEFRNVWVVEPPIGTKASCAWNVGEMVAQPVEFRGGAPETWTIDPPLPEGLRLEDGMIVGSPVAPTGATTYFVTGANLAGESAAEVSIEIGRPGS